VGGARWGTGGRGGGEQFWRGARGGDAPAHRAAGPLCPAFGLGVGPEAAFVGIAFFCGGAHACERLLCERMSASVCVSYVVCGGGRGAKGCVQQ
jgi:hypothetical protein